MAVQNNNRCQLWMSLQSSAQGGVSVGTRGWGPCAGSPVLCSGPLPRHQLLCARKPQKRAHCQCRGLRGPHTKEHLVWEASAARNCRARAKARRGREGRCGAHSSPPGGTAEECSFCPRWRQAVTEAPEEDLFPHQVLWWVHQSRVTALAHRKPWGTVPVCL